MNVDAMATRMSVLTRALPMRILVVDDDELELALMADRLGTAGFEVVRAQNGEEALTQLDRQWFPLIITDWQMPVMDGIQLTENLRGRGVADTYVIMLTMRESSMDYERGYYAGVDDYLTKKLPDAELFARIHAAFNTLALRRSLLETRAALAATPGTNAASEANSEQELKARLHAELRRAQRYGRLLAVMTLGVQSARPMGAALLNAVVQTLQSTVRMHIDWVGRLASSAPDAGTGTSVVFAIIMPETGATDSAAIKDRISTALAPVAAGEPDAALQFTYGFAGLERGGHDGKPVQAEELLTVAEHCRSCEGRSGTAQLNAVQRSVAIGATIACRHGYAVDSHCALKADSRADSRADSPADTRVADAVERRQE